jgi:hypothetical protein
LFVAYALPLIKKEGTKYAREWLSKRGRGGGA